MSLLELMTQQTAGGLDSAIVTRQCTVVLTAEATEEPRGKDSVGTEAPVETALYVASNLETWETKEPTLVSRDTTIDGVCYRRLDPEYYAWLRHKMALAKKALESGKLDPVAFDGLRTRFNRIHDWALGRFADHELLAAVRTLHPKAYPAPATKLAVDCRVGSTSNDLPAQDGSAPPVVPDLLPKDGNRFFTETIAPSAVAKVNAIRDQALALGWNEARLYENRGRFRFPCGGDYGLVCFVGDERHIDEVTKQHIEIVVGSPSRESRWRFYNPDVVQPWMGRALEENQCLSARAVKQ